jgi:hypothetical protein
MYLFYHVRRDDVSTFAKGQFDVCTYTVFLEGDAEMTFRPSPKVISTYVPTPIS